MTEADPAPPATDQAFQLRSPPPGVTRLSRKALAALSAVAGIGIGGALLYGLSSRSHQPPAEQPAPAGSVRPAFVTTAPKDYAQAAQTRDPAVPKLGPPMPGDLGRPFLRARQGGGTDAVADQPTDPRTPADPARERVAQEQDTARASRLFLGGGGGAREATAAPAAAPAPDPVPLPQTAPAGQDARRAFLASRPAAPFESAARLAAPSSPYVLQAGTIIPAALITGIRSDLPGQVTAEVTQNVHDSPTGRILLIPQSARLIGEYDSSVAAGQNRVLLAWDRLILPDGRSIALDRQPGADAAGKAGLQDRTDHHWGAMLRAAAISTLLGMGSELAAGSDDALTRALRRSTQDTINQTGQQLVQRQASIAPTLTIRPGFPLRVVLTRDLILERNSQ